jgi:hypothetical protein
MTASDHHGEQSQSPLVFNSIFETGVRAIFLLVSMYPDTVDLEDLVALDHLVVHSEDVGGPNSLHPATTSHATEMLVRRELIQNGLLLMQTRSMVERIANAEGIFYRAGDEAHNFVRYLTSPYFPELRQAATFLIDLRKRLGRSEFQRLVEQQLERWAIQFQSLEAPGIER